MLKEKNNMSTEKFNIEKIKADFEYFLDAIPFVEMGDTSKGSLIKLRANIESDGKIPYGDIMFELQWLLYRRQQQNPKFKKLLVSDLQLTQMNYSKDFSPLQGLMIRIKFE